MKASTKSGTSAAKAGAASSKSDTRAFKGSAAAKSPAASGKAPIRAAAGTSKAAKASAQGSAQATVAKSSGAKATLPKQKSSAKSASRSTDTATKAAAKEASKPAARKTLDSQNARSVAAAAVASTTADSQGYVIINGRRVRMISTKGIQIAKKSKNADAKAAAAEEAETLDVSTIRTKLSKRELEHYKALLEQRRAEILGLVRGMEHEALRSNGGNLSHMPIHMADIGTDTADQDFALNLAEKERVTLAEIEAALERIERGTYGVCQATGKPIPKARLDAKPWAKYTIEAARMVESGHRF